MAVSEFLYPILSAGAALMASSAAGEFAKSAGKEAFEKLKALLVDKHEVKNLDLLERVAETPALADAIRDGLDKSSAGTDPEVKALAQAVLAALEAMPPDPAIPALDAKTIRAAGDQVFEDIEGIRADEIVSGGAQTFKGLTSPKK
ncbi:MAG: hypothetical protein AAGF13_00665 [Pseudomonadota bacterium]